MWLANGTRPDVSFAVNNLARRMANPVESDFRQMIGVARNLSRHDGVKLTYRMNKITKSDTFNIETFVDSSFENFEEDERLVSGYVTFLSGNIISWGSKRQRCLPRSTTTIEMVALDDSLKGTFRLKNLITKLSSDVVRPYSNITNLSSPDVQH